MGHTADADGALTEESSFGQKLNDAWDLSIEIIYLDDAGNLRDLDQFADLDQQHLIHGYADGLYHKYHETRITGRCSPAAFLNYDMADEEAKLDEHLQILRSVLDKIEGKA